MQPVTLLRHILHVASPSLPPSLSLPLSMSPLSKMLIVVPVYAMGRDPRYFHNPEQFNPDRWDTDYHHFASLPFGYGPRACYGNYMLAHAHVHTYCIFN